MKYLVTLKSCLEKDKYKSALFFILIFLAVFSIYSLRPQIAGDSLLYVDSIEVLKTGVQPEGFVPMMIISTYLGMAFIMLLDIFTGNIEISWLILDSVLYVVMGMFSYLLMKKIFNKDYVAFLGAIFLVTNYSAITFGLGYLMDMGGWTAYVASLYFAYKYLENGEEGKKWLYVSATMVGIGGLYKEYAFVAYVIIFGLILFKNWKNWKSVLKKTFITGLLAFGPFIILNIYGFFAFQYTYLDWFLFNQGAYAYQNRPIEFIKSFGSIYNFGWFLFLPGFYLFLKRAKEMLRSGIVDKKILFIGLMMLSCFSVLLWPVVTRVLFITMPTVILVSSLFIEKIKKTYYIIPILIFYIISAYFMDAYILDFINLPF